VTTINEAISRKELLNEIATLHNEALTRHLSQQAASAYEQATDGCRRSVISTRHNAPQWQRVKPDQEVNPLAEFDHEEGATWNEPLVTTPRRVRRTDRIGIQIPSLFAPPTEIVCVVVM
jgi:hypothetical protein